MTWRTTWNDTSFTRDLKNIDTFSEFCGINDLKVVFKRTVPVDISALGQQALESLPQIIQVFVGGTCGGIGSSLFLSLGETTHKWRYLFQPKGTQYHGVVQGIVSQGMRGIGFKDKKYNIHKSS